VPQGCSAHSGVPCLGPSVGPCRRVLLVDRGVHPGVQLWVYPWCGRLTCRLGPCVGP